MNFLLLRRAISAAELLYGGNSSCRWSCRKNVPFIGPLQPNQHSSLYSLSTTTCTSSTDSQKESKASVTANSSRSRTRKKPVGLASAEMIVKPTTMDNDLDSKEKDINVVKSWPKPGEIPWQPKVANSVNLIGRVQFPVQFKTSLDGKVWAATVIYTSNESGPDSPSFWIPIIFEGDLAHTAVCHLKVHDFVHISGHLSADPPPFTLTDGQASAQVMARSLSYVHVSSRTKKPFILHDIEAGIKESTEIPKINSSENQLKKNIFLEAQLLRKGEILTHSLKEDNLVKPCRINGSTEIQEKLGSSTSNNNVIQENNLDRVSISMSLLFPGGETKFEDDADRRWKEFLNNLENWQDNREKKLSGSLKPNYPDFKHKESGLGIWLNRAPKWVMAKLGGQPPSLEQENKFRGFQQKNDSWKNLVENPNKWWDNRTSKRNVRAPDFKHRETGEGLWLNDCPVSLEARLPPIKT
ncbi:protein OSB2, chloroplastic-like [Impatiens glandulifera]|uniref:protein OSB2, chloroplastic-like n=1 Tax=Impatiens glandulifera TaxID=253017 RepID=UPI001FB0CF3D|nr:protein OSB2, chloroplastic-like [Impatiens glandulifera]